MSLPALFADREHEIAVRTVAAQNHCNPCAGTQPERRLGTTRFFRRRLGHQYGPTLSVDQRRHHAFAERQRRQTGTVWRKDRRHGQKSEREPVGEQTGVEPGLEPRADQGALRSDRASQSRMIDRVGVEFELLAMGAQRAKPVQPYIGLPRLPA
jgi:hypothetical protein